MDKTVNKVIDELTKVVTLEERNKATAANIVIRVDNMKIKIQVEWGEDEEGNKKKLLTSSERFEMNEQTKDILRRAIRVVAYRREDMPTCNYNKLATTGIIEMDKLADAIVNAFGDETGGDMNKMMIIIDKL